jgi:hypothetical protein
MLMAKIRELEKQTRFLRWQINEMKNGNMNPPINDWQDDPNYNDLDEEHPDFPC